MLGSAVGIWHTVSARGMVFFFFFNPHFTDKETLPLLYHWFPLKDL